MFQYSACTLNVKVDYFPSTARPDVFYSLHTMVIVNLPMNKLSFLIVYSYI